MHTMVYRALILVIAGMSVDMVLWGLSNVPFPYVSRAVFYTLVGSHLPIEILACALVGAVCPFFFMADSLGVDVLISVLLGALVYYGRSVVDVPFFGFVGMIFCVSVLHSLFLKVLVGKIPLGSAALLYAFLSSLSVVYLWRGSQGNRSH